MLERIFFPIRGNFSARFYHEGMITPEILEVLRCPMDPQRQTKLELDEARLLCSRCKLQFRIREGFPSLLIEEATLPEGYKTLKNLPCQQK